MCIQAMTVGVIRLKTKAMAHPLLPCDLKSMIGTVGARFILVDLSKSCVWSCIRHRGKAAWAPCLIRIRRVNLIRHLDRPRSEVFHNQAQVFSELMLDARSPLHAVLIFSRTPRECSE